MRRVISRRRIMKRVMHTKIKSRFEGINTFAGMRYFGVNNGVNFSSFFELISTF